MQQTGHSQEPGGGAKGSRGPEAVVVQDRVAGEAQVGVTTGVEVGVTTGVEGIFSGSPLCWGGGTEPDSLAPVCWGGRMEQSRGVLN